MWVIFLQRLYSGVRCEANEYAKLNPGTRFIIETRDVIRYLNINEVNRLSFKDTTAESGVECGGIDFDATCKPARLDFTGGGGVGAKGTPVIGNDGSLMSVILQEGGYGYQYPPQAKISDSCGKGAGAVVRAFTDTIVRPLLSLINLKILESMISAYLVRMIDPMSLAEW